MMDAKYTKRQIAAPLRIRKVAEENKRLRELAADLPFYKVILQEIWERQHREARQNNASIRKTGAKWHHQLP